VRILIDTSAWIEFLNGSPSATAEQVAGYLGGEADLCTCGLIATEVLQGLRRDAGLRKVIELFEELTFLEPSGIGSYFRAAEVYRELRQRGTTVRSTIDCLIAVLAEEHGCAVLARDRDLDLILDSGLVKTLPPG
jgi:predicted nucleic acid-binding protein